MKTSLKWIEHFIRDELSTLLVNGGSQDVLLFHKAKIHDKSKEVNNQIFETLTSESISQENRKQKVWCFQKKIIRLMDLLFEQDCKFWQGQIENNETHLNWNIYQSLVLIRSYLSQTFKEYYCHNQPISKIDNALLIVEVKKGVEQLESLFRPYVNLEIVGLMLSPLTRFIIKNESEISIQRSYFLKRYLSLISNTKVSVDKERFLENCKKQIFRYDINSPRVFKYFIDDIETRMNELDHLNEKIEFLVQEKDRVKKLYSKNKVSLKLEYPPLKSQITDWITESIKSFENQISIQKLFTQEPVPRKNLKIKTNLSVHEIALLVRVIIESNLIVEENVTQALKWTAKNVASKKSENVSSESLRTKYYEVPEVSRKKIEHYLNQMKLQIEKLD